MPIYGNDFTSFVWREYLPYGMTKYSKFSCCYYKIHPDHTYVTMLVCNIHSKYIPYGANCTFTMQKTTKLKKTIQNLVLSFVGRYACTWDIFSDFMIILCWYMHMVLAWDLCLQLKYRHVIMIHRCLGYYTYKWNWILKMKFEMGWWWIMF